VRPNHQVEVSSIPATIRHGRRALGITAGRTNRGASPGSATLPQHH
jgi:hypothetical protein